MPPPTTTCPELYPFFRGNALGVSTQVQASIDEAAAEKTKAREALIGSAGMEQLLKLVGVEEATVRLFILLL